MKKRRNSAQKATMGPKTQADLAGVKFQNVRNLKNASIALAPTALAQEIWAGGPKRTLISTVSKAGGRVSVSPRKDPCGSHHASQTSSQKATVGPKTQADLAGVKFQNVRKLKNASIALAPTALVRKKSATRGPKQEEEIAL